MPTPDRTSLSEIVEAGRDLLEESGPAGVTMQNVAARVGVRAPSLYKRVRDLDALREAVNTANLNDLADQVLAADTSLEALSQGVSRLCPRASRGLSSALCRRRYLPPPWDAHRYR